MFAFLKTHPIAYPALEVLHLIGIALLLGNLLMLELRALFGVQSPQLIDLAPFSLKLVLLGFGIAVTTGLLMFATQPLELLANRAFTIKIGLMGVAACTAAWFHGRGGFAKPDGTAKLLLTASALTWLGVLTAGRWIGYM